MNFLSDSESSDSDTRRRYKTESTRAREEFRSYGGETSKYKSRIHGRNVVKSSISAEKNNGKHVELENESSLIHCASKPQKQCEYQSIDDKTQMNNLSKTSKRGRNKESHFKHNIVKKEHRSKHQRKKGSGIEKFIVQMPSSAKEDIVCGPSLPPHMLKIKENPDFIEKMTIKPIKETYGPSLPLNYKSFERSELDNDEMPENKNEDGNENEDDDEDLMIGPVLEPIPSQNEVHLKLEKRALEMKLAKLNKEKKKDCNIVQSREEWMTQLPDLRTVADLGVTARQFRTKEHEDLKDRSIWTETPHDRQNKITVPETVTNDNRLEIKKVNRERLDAEQADIVLKHKKKHKRNQSLIDLHQKNMRKETKGGELDRRPFSRETDLQFNRFNDAQKKSILKKAQLLDARFSSGQSKYL